VRRATHRLDDEFRERTLFLWATLGVVSHMRRYTRAVAAAPRTGVALTLVDASSPVAGREALFAVLGLVSAARTARAQWRYSSAPTVRARRQRSSPQRRLARPRALLV
jgi:hypothetical protein